MSTIYFNVMEGNERRITVEIRMVAENMTPPVWGYEITYSRDKPSQRGTVSCAPQDTLQLIHKVLADYEERMNYEQHMTYRKDVGKS